MFGWQLKRTREIELEHAAYEFRLSAQEREIARLAEYVAKCERLIEHERERIDSERERADRTTDALLQQNGLPATTSTVLTEQKAQEVERKEAMDDHMKILAEIYGEQMEELAEEGLTVPEGLMN